MKVLVAVVLTLFLDAVILAAGPGGKGNDYCAPGCRTMITDLTNRITTLEQKKEWEMLFRASTGDGGNLVEKWESTHAYNDDQAATAHDLSKDFTGVYKSSKVEDWNSMVIDEVKVALFDKTGAEKAFMIFDGSHTTKMAFFSQENLLASSMKNMKDSSYNYFSLKGHDVWSRHFFASKSYGGCGSDLAFLCVVDDNGPTACDWMNRGPKPYFLYCPNDGPCNLETEAAMADTFAIFVKTR